MKVLAGELMNSKLPEEYPYVPYKEYSIIDTFFRLKNDQIRAQGQLINWIFETFPVEAMRKKIIQEYFGKMRRLEDMMTAETPLGGLNFQCMSSVKLIVRMIKNKELQPFEPPILKVKKFEEESLVQIPLLFKKYYEDIDYICTMKPAKEYQLIHFQLCNIADMAGYR